MVESVWFLKRSAATDAPDDREEALRASRRLVLSGTGSLSDADAVAWMHKKVSESKESARDVYQSLLFVILTDSTNGSKAAAAAVRDLKDVTRDSYETVIATLLKLVEEKWPRMTPHARTQVLLLLDVCIKQRARRADLLCSLVLRQIAGGSYGTPATPTTPATATAAPPATGAAAAATNSSNSAAGAAAATAAAGAPGTTAIVGSESRALAKELLQILLREKAWLYTSPFLLQSVIYQYLRVVSERVMAAAAAGSTSVETTKADVVFLTSIMTERPKDWIGMGRDLIRVLNEVPRTHELFPAVWKLLRSPATTVVTTAAGNTDSAAAASSTAAAASSSASNDASSSLMDHVLSLPTPPAVLRIRLTPEMESQLMFMMQRVKMGDARRYQTWFVSRFLPSVESGSLVPDLIRFICGCWHPPNAVLRSDVVHRWAMLGWLIKTVRGPVAVASTKQAIVYDYLYFEASTNIMNVEPCVLLMMHSLPKYVDITQSLVEFILAAVDGTQPPALKARVVSGVESAFKTVVTRGVVPSLDAIVGSPLLHPKVFDKFRALFPNLNVQRGTAMPAPTATAGMPSTAAMYASSSPSSPGSTLHVSPTFGAATPSPHVVVSPLPLDGGSGNGGGASPSSQRGAGAVTTSQLKRPVTSRFKKEAKTASPTAAGGGGTSSSHGSPTSVASDDDSKPSNPAANSSSGGGANNKRKNATDWSAAAAKSSAAAAAASDESSDAVDSARHSKRMRPATSAAASAASSPLASGSYSPPTAAQPSPSLGATGLPSLSLTAADSKMSDHPSSASASASDGGDPSSPGPSRRLKKPRSRQKAESELNALMKACQLSLDSIHAVLNQLSTPTAPAPVPPAGTTLAALARPIVDQFTADATKLFANRPPYDTILQLATGVIRAVETEFSVGANPYTPSPVLNAIFAWADQLAIGTASGNSNGGGSKSTPAATTAAVVSDARQLKFRVDLLRAMSSIEPSVGFHVLTYCLRAIQHEPTTTPRSNHKPTATAATSSASAPSVPLYLRYCRAPPPAILPAGTAAPASGSSSPRASASSAGATGAAGYDVEHRQLIVDLECCRDRCFPHLVELCERMIATPANASGVQFRAVCCESHIELLQFMAETLTPTQALTIQQLLSTSDGQLVLLSSAPASAPPTAGTTPTGTSSTGGAIKHAVACAVATLKWSGYEQSVAWQWIVAELNATPYSRGAIAPFLHAFLPELARACTPPASTTRAAADSESAGRATLLSTMSSPYAAPTSDAAVAVASPDQSCVILYIAQLFQVVITANRSVAPGAGAASRFNIRISGGRTSVPSSPVASPMNSPDSKRHHMSVSSVDDASDTAALTGVYRDLLLLPFGRDPSLDRLVWSVCCRGVQRDASPAALLAALESAFDDLYHAYAPDDHATKPKDDANARWLAAMAVLKRLQQIVGSESSSSAAPPSRSPPPSPLPAASPPVLTRAVSAGGSSTVATGTATSMHGEASAFVTSLLAASAAIRKVAGWMMPHDAKAAAASKQQSRDEAKSADNLPAAYRTNYASTLNWLKKLSSDYDAARSLQAAAAAVASPSLKSSSNKAAVLAPPKMKLAASTAANKRSKVDPNDDDNGSDDDSHSATAAAVAADSDDGDSKKKRKKASANRNSDNDSGSGSDGDADTDAAGTRKSSRSTKGNRRTQQQQQQASKKQTPAKSAAVNTPTAAGPTTSQRPVTIQRKKKKRSAIRTSDDSSSDDSSSADDATPLVARRKNGHAAAATTTAAAANGLSNGDGDESNSSTTESAPESDSAAAGDAGDAMADDEPTAAAAASASASASPSKRPTAPPAALRALAAANNKQQRNKKEHASPTSTATTTSPPSTVTAATATAEPPAINEAAWANLTGD